MVRLFRIALLLALSSGIAAVALGCSDDAGDTSSKPPGSFGGSSSGGGATPGVACTHPGAGKSLGNDRCECTTTLDVSGDWSASRTCREGDTCPAKAGDESLHITQAGTEITATSPTYRITGTLCGDTIVFSGGPTSGEYKECGQLRFTDPGRYVKDGCFVASGSCVASFGAGCPSQKGQCTGVGAKKPAAAPPIVKDICL